MSAANDFMKKIVTSAGIVALGAATLYGYDPEMTRAQTGRPWSVAATVRGFYDDNPTTSPDRFPSSTKLGTFRVGEPDDSFGFEVNPSVQVAIPLEQTFLRAGYNYSLRYYEDRDPDNYDQTHEFTALLRHAFSPRHDITVGDSFVISKEPTVIDNGASAIITVPTRTEKDVYRNRGTIDYNVMLTEVMGLGLGYANTWYDYDRSGAGSLSALLDRIEHLFRGDLRWQLNPSLVGLIGYQFGVASYTADEFLIPGAVAGLKSEDRDTYSHYVYVGADHQFNQKLHGSVRVGGRYTDYHEIGDDQLSPYADASLSYSYLPGSFIQVGLRHDRNATDIAAPKVGGGRPTLDQESTGVYAQLKHQITRDLTGSLLAQVQHSTFNGGAADDQNETFYLFGLNLEYRINNHWAVETGYNFDLLNSDLTFGPGAGPLLAGEDARSYDRNRVYVGVRASY